jgi:ABC-type polysaccharide/polyol phosphate export permease
MDHNISAFGEVLESFRRWRLWVLLGWHDLKQRYYRTFLGPLWMTFGLLIFVSGMGVFWGVLLKVEVRTFIPYFCAGLISWQSIAKPLSEGATSFISGTSIIQTTRVPLLMHPLRLTMRTLSTYFHALIAYFVVAIVLSVPVNAYSLAIFPAFAVIFINCFWVSTLLGMIGARFRDLPPMIDAIIPFLFFLTPILWRPKMLGSWAFTVQYNPLAHFIEVLRNPLLGQPSSPLSYGVVAAVTVIGLIGTFLFFRRFRSRIIFWL